MATNRPDPGEFLEMAQRMLRELFGERRDDDARDDDARDDEDPWSAATRGSGQGTRHREPSARAQRENLTFALATRAVEALEDLALNVAAIRQRLERIAPQPTERPSESPDPGAAEA